VPIAVTVVVNLLFGQGAVTFMERTVRKVMEELETSLANGDHRKSLAEWRARLVPLLETAQHGAEKVPRPGRLTVPAIRALLEALVILEALPDDLPDTLREDLATRVRACRHAIGGSHAASAMNESLTVRSQFVDTGIERAAAVTALFGALSSLLIAIAHPRPLPDETKPPRQPFVADTFSNPAHWQFALKTTMAVMVSYAIYTLLDWPGMRTAVVTCFFVALSSLGETVHKLLLRLSGALIGGLIAGACIVFVLPHLTDIGQLCLLIATVSAGAAWVATSSELLAYAGLQIAFAFFLGILQGYAPATDLTVLRDRVAGILLGNIVITIVFSSFWPQSTKSGVRAALADALRAIGEAIRRPANAEEARVHTVQALVRADHLRTLSLFELRMLPSHTLEARTTQMVGDIERLAGAAFVVTADSISVHAQAGPIARLAQWAESAADDLSRNPAMPPGPAPAAFPPASAAVGPEARLAQQAIEQLESEVRHVASAMH
jgi:multidrug resistance protein MdtO